MSLTFAAVDIGASLQQALDTFFAFLPRLLGFLIVLAIGFIVAKVVKSLLIKLLGKVGLDRAMHSGSVGQYVSKASPDRAHRESSARSRSGSSSSARSRSPSPSWGSPR